MESFNDNDPPTESEEIDAALVQRTADGKYQPHSSSLHRLQILFARKIKVPLKSQAVLFGGSEECARALILEGSADGSHLCNWDNLEKNRGYSVLMLPAGTELSRYRKGPEVAKLLSKFPDQLRLAANVCSPTTGITAAIIWRSCPDVLEELQKIAGVSLWDLRDDLNRSLLHHLALEEEFDDAASVEWLRDSCQPRRFLRAFVAAKDNNGDTAADRVLRNTGCDLSLKKALLELPGTEACPPEFLDPKTAAVELAAFRSAELKNCKLLRQEQICVTFDDGAAAVGAAAADKAPYVVPLPIVATSETLNAELERWQPSAPAEAAPLSASLLRSVSVGCTPRRVVEAYWQLWSLAPERRSIFLDTLEVDTILNLMVFLDKFLIEEQAALHSVCEQAVRDAIAPWELSDEMVAGAERAAAGDVRGELLMEALLPSLLDNYETVGRGAWIEHGSMPRDIIRRVMLHAVTRAGELSEEITALKRKRD